VVNATLYSNIELDGMIDMTYRTIYVSSAYLKGECNDNATQGIRHQMTELDGSSYTH